MVEENPPSDAMDEEQEPQPQPGAVAEAFADAIVAPCLILSTREEVLHMNPAAIHELPGARIGEPISFAIRHPEFLSAMEEVRQTGTPHTVQVLQSFPNMTWYSITVAPLNLPEGESFDEFLLVTLENRTEQKRTETMRVDFVANVSHELRTPLTSLIGFVDTLLGAAANDKEARERFLPVMRQQAERMSKLIDDLLSLSRLELRQHVRPTEKTDLVALILEVKEGLQTQIEKSGVKIELKIPEEPAFVTGDRDELYEVLENLIDNALKYGGSGGRVDVELRPTVRRTDFAFVLSVRDYGTGIAKAHVPRLTERFYRVEGEQNRQKKGTGLGLAIVKHIVSRHHGQLNISSTLQEGTRIEILLPR